MHPVLTLLPEELNLPPYFLWKSPRLTLLFHPLPFTLQTFFPFCTVG
jgi:biotin transporter BioY